MAMSFAVVWIAFLLIVTCMAEARVTVHRTNLPKSAHVQNFKRMHVVNAFGSEKTGSSETGKRKMGTVLVIRKIHNRKLVEQPTFKILGKNLQGIKGGRLNKRNP
ncbi:hypothetical protein SUGI_0710690 [Cryptomeria japonica]|nr:hypothetical protein SUGI_0710690 [Cryptomeria japonica]